MSFRLSDEDKAIINTLLRFGHRFTGRSPEIPARTHWHKEVVPNNLIKAPRERLYQAMEHNIDLYKFQYRIAGHVFPADDE